MAVVIDVMVSRCSGVRSPMRNMAFCSSAARISSTRSRSETIVGTTSTPQPRLENADLAVDDHLRALGLALPLLQVGGDDRLKVVDVVQVDVVHLVAAGIDVRELAISIRKIGR